ncbi:MAG: glycoside hydrolase family 88 protein [Planctomycetes bacterium]|nr:glycoside hydrolase family 88 protein [Planctomycetota bacterium]
MIRSNESLTAEALRGKLARLWQVSAGKIVDVDRSCPPERGAPVFTVDGRYTARGWTEWTQGFVYGSALLDFDATGERALLDLGRRRTLEVMAPHLTHGGVHDHGFNNVSTYGALRRLALEGRFAPEGYELAFYELALKVSGAVQAARWTKIENAQPEPGGCAELGYVHSFNGPHSLFADTLRTLRALALSHALGHVLQGEGDQRFSLLARLVQHAETTARFTVYYGEGRDAYDVAGRVAHESLFDVVNGRYRCPSTQQGYSAFSTWTRGLAWVVLGYAELLEWIATRPEEELAPLGGKGAIEARWLRAARTTSEFHLAHVASCGVPYWDTGAPGLARLGDWGSKPADPYNEHEPVDSSAAAIAAQGLLRLSRVLAALGEHADARRYRQAGLTTLATLLEEPYLALDPRHQGLLLHAVYHRPNGWDHVPRGRKVPCGEACQWGDYHLRELALLVQREIDGRPWLTFFGPSVSGGER